MRLPSRFIGLGFLPFIRVPAAKFGPNRGRLTMAGKQITAHSLGGIADLSRSTKNVLPWHPSDRKSTTAIAELPGSLVNSQSAETGENSTTQVKQHRMDHSAAYTFVSQRESRLLSRGCAHQEFEMRVRGSGCKKDSGPSLVPVNMGRRGPNPVGLRCGKLRKPALRRSC